MKLLVVGQTLIVNVQKKGAPSKRIPLPSELAQVNQILRASLNRALVIGMVNGDAWEVSVLDLNAYTVTDSFLAYEPVASPDGRYVAFIKFFPTHFAGEAEHHYMLYDAKLAASENRPAGTNSSDRVNVGICVYPLHIGNHDGDNTNTDPQDAHIMAADNFFWSSDSAIYSFADKHGDIFTLVLARVEGINAIPVVSTIDITKVEMCASLHRQDCEVHLSAIDFAKRPEESVHAIFRGINVPFRQEFQFRLDQFATPMAHQKENTLSRRE
ncbi:MAG TPA: hypothetical protein VFF95_01320 [Candidatus Binatus sp.]|jgi:hypothetical protein|nr:hypothetical protein [Candidatus Binatus sp.]